MSLSGDHSGFFARASLILSSICVVHCLATPFVLLLLPALSTFFSETIERIIVLMVVPVSFFGFFPRWMRHRQYHLLILYVISLSLILVSQFHLHGDHAEPGAHADPGHYWVSSAVMIAGAVLLAWVVFRNNRHTHFCTNPDHHH